MLKGRLGIDAARIPHADRHGLIWLRRGALRVEDGCLTFGRVVLAEPCDDDLEPGDYAIPFQGVSCIILEPGTSVTHDVFRLAARHGCGLMAVGDGGVRVYTAPPTMPDRSDLARMQARAWADPAARMQIAGSMFRMRFGSVPPARNLDELRGLEAARMRAAYKLVGSRFGIAWERRRFDRSNPTGADEPNQAVNHAATSVYACATVAVHSVGAIPQLGFVHEDSGNSFSLDIADLFRLTVTLEVAFSALKEFRQGKSPSLERSVRKTASATFRKRSLVSDMIDRIKELFPCP